MSTPAPSRAVRAAAVQAAPVWLDLQGSVDKAISLIEQAAADGVELLGFPEAWIPGYPWWIWLDGPAAGMRFVGRYHDNSLRVDGPEVERIAAAARRGGVAVVLGYSERAGGSLYMGQMVLDRHGRVVATRRKLKPTHVERSVFGEGDGSDLAVHELDVGRVGALCCWEHLQPLSKYAMYSQGEEIHVASWPSFSLYRGMAYALGPELNLAASQLYAAEGGCYVLAAVATVSDAMLAELGLAPDREAWLRAGGGYAMIYGPDGAPLAEPLPEGAEGLVTADLDMDAIALAKSVTDPAGHYARPDAVRLVHDRRPRRPVEAIEADGELAAPAAAADGRSPEERAEVPTA